MSGVVHMRACAFCGDDFKDRGPGSGIPRTLCSVKCERARTQARANKAASTKRRRQRQARAEVLGEPDGSWFKLVCRVHGWDCLSCGAQAQQAHHIVGRSVIANAAHLSPAIRRRLEWDPTNGFPICVRCHELHTNAVERLYFSMLPSQAVEWAVANGFASRVFDDRIYLGAPDEREYGVRA